MKGDVVVIPFPFSDLSGSKRRPALVIADWGGDDVMLCQITSQSKRDGLEVPLTDLDFASGRLPIASHIRPNKVFTADRRIIKSVAGKVNDSKYREVAARIMELVS
ncbi:MAG: type II toxin-antitoxin system PemK/MazF family toxin [Flavobacteriales bacterium]|nr:type II toxin-antitoxin system PemK/MazF family toxin [Flavobacteriales bacterium]